MGKYTSLARQLEEPRPQKKGLVPNLVNTYKHSIVVDNKLSSVESLSESATPLRGLRGCSMHTPPSLRRVRGV